MRSAQAVAHTLPAAMPFWASTPNRRGPTLLLLEQENDQMAGAQIIGLGRQWRASGPFDESSVFHQKTLGRLRYEGVHANVKRRRLAFLLWDQPYLCHNGLQLNTMTLTTV